MPGMFANWALISFSKHRKIYWTDGNTINMAHMDGSNSKVLHQNQREPVGQWAF